ncbi:MAG: HAMP domain-containing protein, partial [Oscillospiraceae bacterium]|nr:HAMP domain-containing protein [Oscillospiraceae bacterium]
MNKTEKRTRISVVIVTGITFIIMLLTIFTSMIGYSEFTSVIERQYNDAAYEVAYTALSYLNPDRFGHYVETLETDEEFDIIQKRLDELTDSMDVNFIYVGEVDPEGRSIIYIYDSVNSSLGYDRYPLGKVGEDFDPQYNQILKDVIRTGEKPETYLYSYTEWGDHTTALLPVKDSSGKVVSIICVEKTMQVLQQSRNTYVNHVVLFSGAVLIIAVLICILFLRYYLIRPIGEVTREAERFADDHSMDSDIKAISSRNEIGVLARSVKRMESDIMQYIDNITKITAEKERISAELNVATQIQADMLPSIFPAFPGRKEFDIYATMT